jgi:hypothetical protein
MAVLKEFIVTDSSRSNRSEHGPDCQGYPGRWYHCLRKTLHRKRAGTLSNDSWDIIATNDNALMWLTVVNRSTFVK